MRHHARLILPILILCLTGLGCIAAEVRKPVPYKVKPKLPDLALPLSPDEIQLQGWLGNRVGRNADERLPNVDLEPLLAGFRQKPGSHPWIGEHIGKWLHAASLAWAYTGNPELRKKMDYAAAELIKTQEPNGYLGTYVSTQRFGLYSNADWDVWSHKYCLIGLLAYHQFTGDPGALTASRKAADLILQTFGPGKKSILSAGTHVGMAATSVLEPIVLLYRFTGEERYLDFAGSIVTAYEETNGPKIVSTLLNTGRTDKTANGKSYEMLSNLVGLCELARVTGDRKLLRAVLNAWNDVVEKRLYITGSASQGELFREDYYLPNDSSAHIAETCVTTTWIQLNNQLLRLTGEARFAHELERSFYNHLPAAQHPGGKLWCYYTPTEGKKDYGPGISCCVSSGPRGMALVPQHACLVLPGGDKGSPILVINLYEDFKARISLGARVINLSQQVRVETPLEASSTIQCGSANTRFALAFRKAPWMQQVRATFEDTPVELAESAGWMVMAAREWRTGDQVVLTMGIATRVVQGSHGNQGKAALTWGPMVLAYDAQQTRTEHPATVALASADSRPPIQILPESTTDSVKFEALIRSVKNPQPHSAVFVPFADAGAGGGLFRVWLADPSAQLPKEVPLSITASESRSRPGNVQGSIIDQDLSSFVVTFDNGKRDQDWFALTFDEPVSLQKVTYAHGKSFHDGGWFDASAGKPRIQIQRSAKTDWETVGEFLAYPETTANDAKDLREGQAFTATLSERVTAVAVRVIGKPASGDNPDQSFTSCAEIQLQ